MVAIEEGPIRVKKPVLYTEPNGAGAKIPAGEHWLVPVQMMELTGEEQELESWIIREDRTAPGARHHVVDCATVERWLEDGDIEVGTA